MDEKQHLRARLRELRRVHVAALPAATRRLLFMRPPASVVAHVPDGSTIGLYAASALEAPTTGYARWFHDRGFALALPWFSDRDAAMTFRVWADPYQKEALQKGPFGQDQPPDDAQEVTPTLMFVPLIGFTATLDRLGQGGGHYDRWLRAHPDVRAVGLAWDVQLVEAIPIEPHDRPLDAVITPTRIFGGLS